MSAVCAPCREVAAGLARINIPEPVIALLAGYDEPADALAAVLPKWIRVIRDPGASVLSELLQIDMTPFVFELEFGRVTGRAFIHEAKDLATLVHARRSGARDLKPLSEVIPSVR